MFTVIGVIDVLVIIMFRTLVVFLEVAVLVIILRTSVVQYFLTDAQDSLSNWMLEISQLADFKELSGLRNTIEPHTQNLRGYQKEYIAEQEDNS